MDEKPEGNTNINLTTEEKILVELKKQNERLKPIGYMWWMVVGLIGIFLLKGIGEIFLAFNGVPPIS